MSAPRGPSGPSSGNVAVLNPTDCLFLGPPPAAAVAEDDVGATGVEKRVGCGSAAREGLKVSASVPAVPTTAFMLSSLTSSAPPLVAALQQGEVGRDELSAQAFRRTLMLRSTGLAAPAAGEQDDVAFSDVVPAAVASNSCGAGGAADGEGCDNFSLFSSDIMASALAMAVAAAQQDKSGGGGTSNTSFSIDVIEHAVSFECGLYA
mmetsp:Transcript_5605/g.14025  ORF Transcript_5605/g.14025 Transcript_5605/m.14025 type:complete len:206 (+) Transcript_5605:3191-3808(+)